ncbi:MAG: DUF6475 domain-containing protein [bacterium]
MFEQDLKKFAELIVGISEVYGKSFTSAAIEIYWRILEPFRLEDVSAAIDRHVQHPDDGKFLPKPSDIIKAIEGSTQSQALSAWSKATYAMRCISCYESVAFDDALIHAVIKSMNGWPKLCLVDDKQLPFTEKEFLERYRDCISREPSSYPKYLKGLIEIQNSARGYIYPPPILIGNVLKAKQVMADGSDAPFLEISTSKLGLNKNEVIKREG